MKNENYEHCKKIAEDLEAVINGEVVTCPECGQAVTLDDDGEVFTCPCCGHSCDIDDAEPVSIYEFLGDIYNIEYRIDSSKEYRSIQLMIACGGPNIYLDTASGDVELYWWTERARYPMSRDVINELDYFGEELWNC